MLTGLPDSTHHIESHGPAHSIDELTSGLRVALVHEWLAGVAGSEQTFAAMAELLPRADLFALSYNRGSGVDLGGRPVRTSALDRLCQRGGRAAALPLMPQAMKHLGRGQEFDLIISSSHAFSRAFAHRKGGVHLSYTYTPMRYVWRPDLERHRSRLRVPDPVLAHYRRVDRGFAAGVQSFAAISDEVRGRIQTSYGRDSRVVYPPCDTDYFHPSPTSVSRRGAVVVARLVSYKRVDLAIDACALAGVSLTVVGDGPERAHLQAHAEARAPGRVRFVGAVSRADLRDAYQRAAVVLFPGVEDFGIVPVEAQSCGAPVVALGVAGALETVLHHPGAFVSGPDPSLFAEAIRQTLDHPPAESESCIQARRFSRGRFDRAFSDWVGDSLGSAGVPK